MPPLQDRVSALIVQQERFWRKMGVRFVCLVELDYFKAKRAKVFVLIVPLDLMQPLQLPAAIHALLADMYPPMHHHAYRALLEVFKVQPVKLHVMHVSLVYFHQHLGQVIAPNVISENILYLVIQHVEIALQEAIKTKFSKALVKHVPQVFTLLRQDGVAVWNAQVVGIPLVELLLVHHAQLESSKIQLLKAFVASVSLDLLQMFQERPSVRIAHLGGSVQMMATRLAFPVQLEIFKASVERVHAIHVHQGHFRIQLEQVVA
jgi:hypothetical protein